MYLINAFSLNMLPTGFDGSLRVEPVTREHASYLARTAKSAVGHEDTAAVLASVLGTSVAYARVTVALVPGDMALVGQYRGPRLQPGAMSLPAGATIEWSVVTVGTLASAKVRAALEATPREYLAQTCALHAGAYDIPADHLPAALATAADWTETEHHDVRAPVRAFVSQSLRGGYELLRTAALPPDTPVEFRDRKGTGRAMGEVEKVSSSRTIEETWLLVGPDSGTDVVYTFHPGAPVPPSELSASEYCGKQMTAAQCVTAGIEYVREVRTSR